MTCISIIQAAMGTHEAAMDNQDGFEGLSQTLLQKTSQIEESLSQLGQRLDSKETLLSQLEITDVSLLSVQILRNSFTISSISLTKLTSFILYK